MRIRLFAQKDTCRHSQLTGRIGRYKCFTNIPIITHCSENKTVGTERHTADIVIIGTSSINQTWTWMHVSARGQRENEILIRLKP